MPLDQPRGERLTPEQIRQRQRAFDPAAKQRAYAVLEIKADGQSADGKRYFNAIASTPTPDRMGDTVQPKGAQFKLPLPLLYHHDSERPIGQVTEATVTRGGIKVRGYVDKLPDAPQVLRDRLDVAWAEMQSGLIRGVSIGFRPLDYVWIQDGEGNLTGGIDFTDWEWLELSAVTIPANSEATITSIKSFDAKRPSPASGESDRRGVVRLHQPVVAGSAAVPTTQRKTAMPTTKEQITSFEHKRAANVARCEELMKLSGDEGRTLDEKETEEYETLAGEVEAIDKHLKRLRAHEKLMPAQAEPAGGGQPSTAGEPQAPARVPMVTFGKSSLPPGVGFARYALCQYLANGNEQKAAQLAVQRGYRDSSPEVFNVLDSVARGWDLKDAVQKTAVAGGTTTDTTWASPLAQYNNLASEFINYLRPLTVLGRLQGVRQVPFMVKIPRQTAGVTGYWVGEAAGKPLSKLAFDSITMGPTKMATIVVITDELARVSSPSAEAVVRDDMAQGLAQFLDQQFLSPGVAGVTATNPASITYGLTPTTSASSGGTSSVANVTTDVKAVFAGFFSANIDTTRAVWIMHPNTALALATMRTSQDIFAFPDITFQGGTFFGLPVVVSGNVPYSVSGGSIIVLVVPNEILLADDGAVTIDASREASLQMVDNPSSSAASLVSMFQTNQLALRAERYVNYAARRTGAVAYIDMVHY